ncbi:hypothetical protein CHUAL_009300 [Chamberlinius hualienensis]
MPIQAPQWTEFLNCPICYNEFNKNLHRPISLGCGHTVCKSCLSKLQRRQCPFDQTTINTDIENLPVNFALLQLVGATVPECDPSVHLKDLTKEDVNNYLEAKKCIEELALYLKPFSHGNSSTSSSALSRPMQRKLVTLINCQLIEEEGRSRAMRAARSLGERTVTELILQHQNPQQLSTNLWAAVRARGCQFLGPAMQEEVLKLALVALDDGSALSRKVLVMFVVQRLEPHFPQASKTSIGHVVQLLYRASCFKVSKREGDSSLMQLKEEFRTYESLRREHDAQIVQIATEAGLRIAPDQWSSLLYGDTNHKSHMQSIIDKLQTPQSFAQSVQELVIALQRTSDLGNLSALRPHLEQLAAIDPSPDASPPTWEECKNAMQAVKIVVRGLVDFIQNHGSRKFHENSHTLNNKYKTSMCRDLTLRGGCPRGANCTFAHSDEEMERYRAKNRKANLKMAGCVDSISGSSNSHMNCIQDNCQLLRQDSSDLLNSQIVFTKNGSIYSNVQSDDLIYSGSTAAVARPQTLHREGYPATACVYPSHTTQQTTLQSSVSSGNRSHSVVVPRIGLPLSLNPESPVYQPYNSGTNPFAAARQTMFNPGSQPLFTGNPVVYPELYRGNHKVKVEPLIPDGDHLGIQNVEEVNPKDLSVRSSDHKWNDGTAPSRPHPCYPSVCVNPTQSLAALQQRRDEILTQLEKSKRDANKSRVPSSTTSSVIKLLHRTGVTTISAVTNTTSTGGVHLIESCAYKAGNCILSTGFASPNQPLKLSERNGVSSVNIGNADGLKQKKAMPEPTEDDQFIPFDPPVVSKYGPISRGSRVMMRSSVPIQVSASLGYNTISTPAFRQPVPAASPLPTWYSGTQGYFATPARVPAKDQMVPVGMTDVLPPSQISFYESNGYTIAGTAPIWTVRESNTVSDPEKLKLELHNLECQINNLKVNLLAVQKKSNPSAIESEKLARELEIIERGIREKEIEIRMKNWDSSKEIIDWKSEKGKNKMPSGRNDEEVYELQVAQDMQEAEKRWLYELEKDEEDWSNGRDIELEGGID